MLRLSYCCTPLAEGYAKTVYPVLVRLVGGFWGLFPFSVGEIIIYAIILSVFIFLIRLVWLWSRRRKVLPFARKGGKLSLWGVAVILTLYTFHCGINYYRLPFSAFLDLELSPSSVEELSALCEELAIQTGEASKEVEEALEALSHIEGQLDLSHRAAEWMTEMGRRFPALDGYYPDAKRVLFSRGMSYLEILGVYFPPTIEANFNGDVPAYTLPATICHELSHLRGFMREDEANFIAYLACRESGEAVFGYSGGMLALDYAMDALYSADADAYRQIIETRYTERMLRDVQAYNDYWRQFEGPVGDISNMANDIYLKANAQADGVRSYGRMVDLLLADYRMRHSLL